MAPLRNRIERLEGAKGACWDAPRISWRREAEGGGIVAAVLSARRVVMREPGEDASAFVKRARYDGGNHAQS